MPRTVYVLALIGLGICPPFVYRTAPERPTVAPSSQRTVASKHVAKCSDAQSDTSNGLSIAVEAPRCRYLSVRPPDLGTPLAIRVTTTNSALFASMTGSVKWVAPMNGTMNRLQCDPVFMDWNPNELVHVTGIEVYPSTTYSIDYTTDGVTFSAPVPALTSLWGDITGGRTTEGWSEPDGIVSVVDLLATLDAFRGLPDAPPRERTDLYPEQTDQIINVLDLVSVVGAFQGQSYPFSEPGICNPPLEGTFDFFEKYTSNIPWYALLIGPNASFYNGKTYVVYQGNGNSYDSYVLSFDHTLREWSDSYLVGEGANDHGVPAILIDTVIHPGQIHVFYAAHHYWQHPQRYARSVYPEDIAQFEQRPVISTAATYPQPMQFADGAIYLFYRDSTGSSVGQDGIWGFRSSADAGDTWSSFSGLLDCVENEPVYVFSWYGRFFMAPNESIHFCGVAHQRAGLPASESWKDLFYMYSCDRGISWFTAEGEPVELPVTPQNAAQIRITETNNSYPPSMAFDQDSRPYLLAIEGTFGEQLNTYLYTHNGSQWKKSLLPVNNISDKEQTGRLIVENQSSIQAFVSSADGLKRLATVDGGVSWSVTDVVTPANPGAPKPAGMQLSVNAPSDHYLVFRKGQELYLWGDNGFARRQFGNKVLRLKRRRV